MRTLIVAALFGMAGVSATSPVVLGTPSAPHYHQVAVIPIGGEGGWDYLAIDPAARRLYAAHATRVVVVQADTGEHVGEIPDTPGVHGVALAEDLQRGFTSNGASSTVSVFDARTLKVLARVATTGQNPDAIVYDPASHRVFTMNGRSDNATAIDARRLEVVGTVALGGRPEFAVADGHGHLYINLEDRSEQVELDTRTLTVTRRWSLSPCQSPSGLAMDTAHRRLFAGCHNQMMAIVDADAGRVIATVPIGRGVDANRYDPATHLVFSSNGDGTLTIVRQLTPDRYEVAENVRTALGARTMELDPVTHRVYLATADFAPATGAPQGRPRPVPGTFRILVFAP
jgi:YVTN family beta-propeller protein